MSPFVPMSPSVPSAPETRMASARLETRTERAVVAMSRVPKLEANSGVMFMNTATFSAFNWRR